MWSTDVQVSFAAIKDALVVAMPLAHPLPHAELLLATDASDTHIGGVLQHPAAARGKGLAATWLLLQEVVLNRV